MKYIWTIIYMFILPLTIMANEDYVNIVPQKYIFKPGTSTSIPITLVNKENNSLEYEITTISRTNKITVLSSNKTIEIEAQQRETIILPINIAKDCPSGMHTIVLKVLNVKTTSYQLFDINIQILRNEDLAITPLSTMEYIRAGDTIITDYVIKNLGNTRQLVKLNTNNGVLKNQEEIYLKPQEEKIITLYKLTNPKATKTYSQVLDLNIKGIDKNVLSAYTNVNVIPINPEKIDAYKRIPIQLTLRYINMRQQEKQLSGFQGELFAKTTLAKENNDMLEVKLITKNPVGQYYYTQYDEYYASYKNQNTYVHIGDKSFNSSYLTEFSRYGRGIELQHKFNKVALSAFYNKPRFYPYIKEEFDVKSAYALNNNNTISLGYFQKKQSAHFNSETFSKVHLPYVNYTSNSIKNTILEVDYAYSNYEKTSGSAYRINIISRLKKLSAGLNYLYSSPQFKGYFSDTKNLNGNINYRLSNRISTFIYHYQNSNNERLDTLFLSAPLFKQSQFGFDYRYARNGQIAIFNGYMKNEDRLSQKLFKYEEYYTRINVSQQISFIQIDFNSQFGYTKNYLTETNGKSSSQQLNLNMLKFNTNFSLFGTVANTNRYESGQSTNFYYGGRIGRNIVGNTQVNIFYQSNYIPEDYYRERSQFEGTITHSYKRHFLEFAGRYFTQRGQIGKKDFLLSLTYKTTLGLPIKKIHNFSTLHGTIRSDNTNLKGIRVQLGNNYAITDKDGNYVFKNISPGDYYLDIDRSSLPIDAISTISLPKSITIENIEMNRQNFEITKAATIKGIIKMEEMLNKGMTTTDLKAIYASNIIIEISDGNKVIRKMCHVNDSFDFTSLQPGLWKVKIYTKGLHKSVKMDNEYFEFNLNSGEQKNLILEVKSNQKEILYQQQSIKVGYNSN